MRRRRSPWPDRARALASAHGSRTHRPRLRRHRRSPRPRPGHRRVPGRRGRPRRALRALARSRSTRRSPTLGDARRRPWSPTTPTRRRPARLIAAARETLGPARRRPDQRRRAADGPGHRRHRRAVDARRSRRCSSARCGSPARSARRCGDGGSLAFVLSLERAGAARRPGDLQRPAARPGDGRQDPRRRARARAGSGSTGCCPGRVGTERVAELDAATGDAEAARRRRSRRSRCGATASRRSSAGPRRSCSRRPRRSCTGVDAPGRRRDAARALSLARRRVGAAVAPLVVGEVAEAEEREHAEEPPLQAVEEVRAVVELGQLGRLERLRPARGPRTASSTKPPYTSRSERRRRSRALEIARVDWSATAVLSPVRVGADPAGDRHLAGRRRGHVAGGRRRWLSVCQPAAVDQQGGAVGGDQRDDHVDARTRRRGCGSAPHGVVGVVGAGRRRPGATPRPRRPSRPGASTSATGAGCLVLVGARRPRCAPCGPRAGGTATRPATRSAQPSSHDDEREQQPAPAEQEPPRPHPVEASRGRRRGRARTA